MAAAASNADVACPATGAAPSGSRPSAVRAGYLRLQPPSRRCASHLHSGLVAPVVKEPDHPLIVLVGPTASGKTSLAIRLAEEFNGEIVSCDSVAVYREMEIGTAKPSHEERALVPHHMIDIAWPDEPCTAGDYSRQAREALCRHYRTRPACPLWPEARGSTCAR